MEHSHKLDPEENFQHFKEVIAKYSTELNVKPHHGFSTRSIHAGQEPEAVHGSVSVPIHLTSTYAQKSPGELYSNFDYSRCGNPTREIFEKCIAELEYAKYGIAFSSGCAALTCVTLMHSSKDNDHIICCDDVYGGTQRFLRQVAAKNYNLDVDFIDLTKLEVLEKTIKPTTKLIWIETPTNPTMKCCDIEAIVAIAKKQGIKTIVDNTFASPYLQSPLLLGADISLNSCTKYIGGHSDLVMGCLTTNDKELRDKLFFVAKSVGGSPSAFDCYLCLRGLKTLKVRMEEHCKNAMIIARFLEKHEKVEEVFYPGLESHPQHEIAKKQMRGFGGMMSFNIKGDLDAVRRFFKKLKFFICAESLGGVESLIETPAIMTHASVPAQIRQELGIKDGLIRISVGIEDVADLLEDLKTGLDAV